MNLVSTQYSLELKALEIFLAGCREHPCIDCHNTELWDEDIGNELNEFIYNKLKKEIITKINLIDNFFITGGEPLEKPKEEIIKLINFLEQFNKKIWLFTRYNLKEVDKDILNLLDYIKVGKYLRRERVRKNIKFGITLSSANQNIYKNHFGRFMTENHLKLLDKILYSNIGKKYGRLNLLAFSGYNKYNQPLVTCNCDCGNNKIINLNHIKNGNISSCGCIAKERFIKYNKNRKFKDRELPSKNDLYMRYLIRCKSNNIKFELDKEIFFSLIKKDCYYCGKKPNREHRNRTSLVIFNGIDRVNNSLGYNINNVVPCCTECNSKKNNLSLEQIENFIKKIKEFNSNNKVVTKNINS